jgi:hypothetical protein
MRNWKSILVVSTLGILIGVFASLSGYTVWSGPEEDRIEPSIYHATQILGKEFFEEAYSGAYDFGDRSEARVLILPDQLSAKSLIAGVLKSQEGRIPETIVVVGLDHSKQTMVTTERPWKTPYGFMNSSEEIIGQLLDENLVEIDHEVFDTENSVSILIPFLHRTFPESEIVPILVQENLNKNDQRLVTDILAQDGVMLVISTHFSRYLPPNIAEFHDIKSLDAVRRLAYEELNELEIDSTVILEFAFDFTKKAGAEYFDFYLNEFSKSSIDENISYIIGAFTEKKEVSEPVITVLGVGDMMFDRGVRRRMDYYGDWYPFENIIGKEGRFFKGIDIIIGNLEGAISERRSPVKKYDFAFDKSMAQVLKRYNFSAVNLANNHTLDQGNYGYKDTTDILDEVGIGYLGHQTKEDAPIWRKNLKGKSISFVGINLAGESVNNETVEDIIGEESLLNDYVVVQIHWGEEYRTLPTESQKEFGRQLVDWGADAVIGHHPHIIQGMEVYRGAPIFWSLGNFIFDQDISLETTRSILAGLVFGQSSTSVHVFPVIIESGQPRLAEGYERESLLKIFEERSDLDQELRIDILDGKLLIDLD